MNDFEIWVYRGLIAAMIGLIYFLFQKWIKRIDLKFDELIKAVQDLSRDGVRHSEQIFGINDRLRAHDGRLNDHSNRIRKLETKDNLNG